MKTLINEANYQIYPQRFKPVNNEVIYQIYPLTFNYAPESKSPPYTGAYGNLKGITAFFVSFCGYLLSVVKCGEMALLGLVENSSFIAISLLSSFFIFSNFVFSARSCSLFCSICLNLF